jgi:hypothetical protein
LHELGVGKNNVLTNQFNVQYVNDEASLLIRTINNGNPAEIPIRLRLDALQKMGAAKASEWVGQTLMLLIPEMREKLFELKD